MRALPRSTPLWMIAAALSGDVRVTASNCAAICSGVRPRPSGSVRTRALRAMFVVTPPGCTATARTPVPRSSWRSASVKPRTANLAAQYALWYGMPSNPNTLEVFTMTPSSCSTRIGRNARVPLTTPQKLVWNSHSSSSGTASTTVDVTATPALLNTAASGAGSQARTSSAKRSWSAASRTSRTRRSTGPGSDASVVLSPASSTSAMATGEPSPDSSRARPRPMPDAAPVIITGRPAILCGRRGIGTPCRCGRPTGVRVDQIEQDRPRALRQIVAHAGNGFQPGAGDRAYRRRGARRVDHPVAIAVDHQRRGADRPQLRGPVAGAHDRGERAARPRGRRVAVPPEPGQCPHPGLVERESVRADVPEHPYRAVDGCLAGPRRPGG